MNELQHHGVKGMKWGVRKKRDYLARDRARAQKKLENAKTERGRAKAQKAVDILAKAETNSYNAIIRSRRRNLVINNLVTIGVTSTFIALRRIGQQVV